MIDLQAHGESPGKQVTFGYLEKHDARAAVEFARQNHPNEPIAVVGVSLGGASALLASPLGIDALVLESVYPNITAAVHNRVAARLGPFSAVPVELFLIQLEYRLGISPARLRPIDHLPDVGETKRMFSVALQPKELMLVDRAAHVDLYRVSPVEYKTRVLRFLEENMRSQPGDSR
jgi:alpha-beta hydrolase superfamily lysophospholipase